jgi:hypothetical protein
MRKQRHTPPGAAQQFGRVGAIGVVAAGALCAAVLSVASRVPPTPIETERIPAVEIGSATEDEATSAVRKDNRAGSRRREGSRRPGAQDRRRRGGSAGDTGRRAGGSAVPVAYGDSVSGATDNLGVGPAPGNGMSDRPVTGTNPGGGRVNNGPGTQPRSRPAPTPPPAPAPAPAPAAGASQPVAEDDGAAATGATGTAASDEDADGDSEQESETASAASIPAPTPAGSDDSGDE